MVLIQFQFQTLVVQHLLLAAPSQHLELLALNPVVLIQLQLQLQTPVVQHMLPAAPSQLLELADPSHTTEGL